MARSKKLDQRFGIVWETKPHEVDGVYVEVQDGFGYTLEDIWLPTVGACEDWAIEHGATGVTKK